jgi:hypothetical protein
LTVRGLGEISASPDQVEFTIGIETTDPNVEKAQQLNNEAARKVIATLKGLGVLDKDVQTTYVNLSQTVRDQDPSRGSQPRTWIYVARKDMRVLLRKIESYENVMSQLMKSGVNQIHSLRFLRSDVRQWEAKARTAALEDAREKAQAMAKTMGVKLGAPLHIIEAQAAPPPMLKTYMMMEVRGAMADAGGPTLAAGELLFTTDVTVSFEIQ